jgi:hypothetical protein
MASPDRQSEFKLPSTGPGGPGRGMLPSPLCTALIADSDSDGPGNTGQPPAESESSRVGLLRLWKRRVSRRNFMPYQGEIDESAPGQAASGPVFLRPQAATAALPLSARKCRGPGSRATPPPAGQE